MAIVAPGSILCVDFFENCLMMPPGRVVPLEIGSDSDSRAPDAADPCCTRWARFGGAVGPQQLGLSRHMTISQVTRNFSWREWHGLCQNCPVYYSCPRICHSCPALYSAFVWHAGIDVSSWGLAFGGGLTDRPWRRNQSLMWMGVRFSRRRNPGSLGSASETCLDGAVPIHEESHVPWHRPPPSRGSCVI